MQKRGSKLLKILRENRLQPENLGNICKNQIFIFVQKIKNEINLLNFFCFLFLLFLFQEQMVDCKFVVVIYVCYPASEFDFFPQKMIMVFLFDLLHFF